MTALLRRHRTHLVDEFGMVGCPRQRRDVPVERCLECRELIDAVHDPDGHLTEIRCRADIGRVSPQDHLDPFGPLVNFRP
ncbi:MAG: hypothetical protein EA340_01255 [Nitriliruptor sp.]|nr:MAG: hypothetical protein EA340_01255 [Nitriliruptor sp.]